MDCFGERGHVQDLAEHSLVIFWLLAYCMILEKRNHTAINKTTKRGKYSNRENPEIVYQSLDTRWTGKPSSPLGKGFFTLRDCGDHFGNARESEFGLNNLVRRTSILFDLELDKLILFPRHAKIPGFKRSFRLN